MHIHNIWAYQWFPDMHRSYQSSVEVKDISLTDYIQVRHAVYLPHTAGRYAKKQFKKAQMPIVERLVDRCVIIQLRLGLGLIAFENIV